ncbi:?-D-glucose-1-phosphatase [Roseovarius litorisediminis]|uniref:?-D-glucose-1-phosphatase n=1 Tax=Roseovarius litorisediminis TaxID=1312363 RepID=A0A1Y5RJG0_9RHOB|nr:HAD family phosphatase [Roseovarius litorisediminis]SLN19025.1 ?-D-glucose-1-phosphatase [Roseovarius litorisediminis]
MKVQAVIWDIGNVLIEWQPERYFDQLIGQTRRAQLFAQVDLFAMMDRIDAGAPFAETIEETACDHPDWQAEIRHFRDNWTALASPAIEHSVRLLRALKSAQVPVFALSNFGVQNFPCSRVQFPFLGEFDRYYISGQMGRIKPDPAIYAAVEADCGIAPEHLLFTDDRSDNINTAIARGWQVHLFDGAKGWAQCLVRSGLLIKENAV